MTSKIVKWNGTVELVPCGPVVLTPQQELETRERLTKSLDEYLEQQWRMLLTPWPRGLMP